MPDEWWMMTDDWWLMNASLGMYENDSEPKKHSGWSFLKLHHFAARNLNLAKSSSWECPSCAITSPFSIAGTSRCGKGGGPFCLNTIPKNISFQHVSTQESFNKKLTQICVLSNKQFLFFRCILPDLPRTARFLMGWGGVEFCFAHLSSSEQTNTISFIP